MSRAWIRPFLVSADATEVKVLGTLFSVNSFKDNVRVTLVRGRVSVHGAADGQRHVELAPGQQVDARRGHALPPVAVDVEAAIAWKDNRLVFEQTTLAEALDVIQRYHAPPIRLDDPSLAKLSISGVFDSTDADGLLALLPSILPLSLSTDADGTVHVRRKPLKK
ncbi:fec operon regulator FecR [compost metagenome]